METVTHHGRVTAYGRSDRGGDGRPICFVHGSGGSHAIWKGQHRLSDEYPTVAVDLSGHGESEDVSAEPGYTTLSAYADDVIAVAKETDANVLVGNSLGGAVVLHILLDRSFDPDAAVLTGTGARLGVLEDLRRWLTSDFESAIEFLHGTGRLLATDDERLREASIETMRKTGQRVTRRDFLTCHRFDVRERLNEIDTPTLVIHGADDQLTPPMFHEYLADEIRETTRRRIDGAAHLAMLERPTTFNDSVIEFLETKGL